MTKHSRKANVSPEVVETEKDNPFAGLKVYSDISEVPTNHGNPELLDCLLREVRVGGIITAKDVAKKVQTHYEANEKEIKHPARRAWSLLRGPYFERIGRGTFKRVK